MYRIYTDRNENYTIHGNETRNANTQRKKEQAGRDFVPKKDPVVSLRVPSFRFRLSFLFLFRWHDATRIGLACVYIRSNGELILTWRQRREEEKIKNKNEHRHSSQSSLPCYSRLEEFLSTAPDRSAIRFAVWDLVGKKYGYENTVES